MSYERITMNHGRSDRGRWLALFSKKKDFIYTDKNKKEKKAAMKLLLIDYQSLITVYLRFIICCAVAQSSSQIHLTPVSPLH